MDQTGHHTCQINGVGFRLIQIIFTDQLAYNSTTLQPREVFPTNTTYESDYTSVRGPFDLEDKKFVLSEILRH